MYSLLNQAGVAVGPEENPLGPKGNPLGPEDLGVEKEGAHVHSPLDPEAAAVGQEADLSLLRVGQVRNLVQLEVAREHRELEGNENTELNELLL